MSTRAYKIIEIKTESPATFNCSYEDRIMNIADLDMFSGDVGIIRVDQSRIEDLKDEELAKPKKKQDKDFLATLDAIIEDCEDNEYVEYYCY
jgi:hypothetical protein